MTSARRFDVVVYGGTAPGIVAAVRSAREGLDVALVTPTTELGGSLPSLGAVETHYRGVRAPLLQEFIDEVIAYYKSRYGERSEQFRACIGGMMITFEPHVARSILARWIENEPRIHLFTGWSPSAVERVGAVVGRIRFTSARRADPLHLAGDAFVEASYEGDLMALAGANWRVGREARSEYGEPRAGRVFTRWLTGTFPRAAAAGRLNLVPARATTSDPLPGSTGDGDDNIQSYSYRLCLTDDPTNRRMLESPPANYDRERFAPILLSPGEKERLALPFHHRFLIYSLSEMVERDHLFHGHALPNRKRSWNATNLTAAAKRYAVADAAERGAIERAHRDHALGLMWFLQNDSAMPSELRAMARNWGLARDEFVDTDNLPSQLYIREARRLIGRAVFTEHDALPAPGLERAPIHEDSIGISEFSLDSLACTTERMPGSGALCDGQLFQMEVSRPGHVPYGVVLPVELDNLLVVTTVSASHVGWGTLRQTPTLMHLAESAAWAIVLASRLQVPPAALDVDLLQRHLVEHRVMISFFNDFDMSCRRSWTPAVQYLGTKGFFTDYDARAEDVLDPTTAADWSRRAGACAAGTSRGAACETIFERLRAVPATARLARAAE